MKQPVGDLHFRSGPRPARLPLLALLTAALCAGPLAAAEVYTWTDENGVVHYSQTPRPEGEDRVIEVDDAPKPGSVPIEPPVADNPADAGEADEPPLTAAQARRQQMDEQRQANRERQAEMRQLCTAHRQRLDQLEPARRVMFTDENGQSVRLDDDQRMALIEESRAYVEKNCAN